MLGVFFVCFLLLTQVGSGNISVVSPPGPYEDSFYQNVPPPAQGDSLPYAEAPPDYQSEEAVGVFSDAAVRRGESRAERGSNI